MKTLFIFLAFFLLDSSIIYAGQVTLEPAQDMGLEYIYQEPSGYNDAGVTVTYNDINDNFRATIQASGLKPEFTYQVKLSGFPSCLGGSDETNEKIGFSGRWSCMDCDASSVSNNRSDYEYVANKALPADHPDKECIAGYLVFGYFVADQNGDVDLEIITDASYHVLWCGPRSGSNADLYSGYTPPGSNCDTGKYCRADDVIPEIERSAFHYLPDGNYLNIGITLTEESFHQNCGTWTTVLTGSLSFEIDRNYDSDNDGCINLIDPDPNSQSADSDEDGYGSDCDCNDQNSSANPAGTEIMNGDATCSDGLDNDCDGFVDGADSGCKGSQWEMGSIVAASAFHSESHKESNSLLNHVLILLFPMGVILILRSTRRK